MEPTTIKATADILNTIKGVFARAGKGRINEDKLLDTIDGLITVDERVIAIVAHSLIPNVNDLLRRVAVLEQQAAAKPKARRAAPKPAKKNPRSGKGRSAN